MKNTLAILSISLGLAACGGSGGSSDSSGANQITTVAGLQGVWDWSDTENGVTDEIYLHISATGSLSLYDYWGDDFDQIADCYFTVENFAFITRQSDSFVWNQSGQESIRFTARLSNSNLVLTNPSDSSDSEEFRSTNLRVADLTPDCSVSAPPLQSKLGAATSSKMKKLF